RPSPAAPRKRRRLLSIFSNALFISSSPLAASLGIGINQREVGRWIVFLLQRNRIDGDKDLQGGRYESLIFDRSLQTCCALSAFYATACVTSADRPAAPMLDGPHWARLFRQKKQREIALFASRHFGRDAISLCTEGIPALHGTIDANRLQTPLLKYLPG